MCAVHGSSGGARRLWTMTRAPFNVLVIAYRERDATREFAVFHRANCEMWQFIAGGGEDDETPRVAAQREAREEADRFREQAVVDGQAEVEQARHKSLRAIEAARQFAEESAEPAVETILEGVYAP